MNDEEYRALIAAGPAVVMVAKEDMLKLLERLIIANHATWYLANLIEKLPSENARENLRVTICDND
jgi:hypothetical protein